MSPTPVRLTTADRALLRARSVWGRAPGQSFWTHFAAGWRSRLEAGSQAGGEPLADRQAARTELAADHVAEARADLTDVHPSWWARALKEESPAVQRAVCKHTDPTAGPALQAALQLAAADLNPDRAPHPEALRWALTLWRERLVGGPPLGPFDPPAIVAIGQPDRHAVSRLLARLGLAKLAFVTNAEGAGAELSPRDRQRLALFQAMWPEADRRLAGVARDDWAIARQMREHALLVLGLTSIARLLAMAEPFRVRWALQHLPYNLAKFARLQTVKTTSADPIELIAWESQLLKAAQAQLAAEPQADDTRKPAP